jgi:hypothetical protein
MDRGATDITGLAEGLDKVALEGDGTGDEMEDNNLTQHRGIFLMGEPDKNKEGGRNVGTSSSGKNIRRTVFSL